MTTPALKMEREETTHRTLTLVQAHLGHPDHRELARLEAADAYPRINLFEESLRSDILNEKSLLRVPLSRRRLYRYLPTNISQVVEAYVTRKNYDVVISWAENLGIPLALLMSISGKHPIHIGIFSWISKFKKAFPLKHLQSQFDRIILMSSRQHEFAVRELGIPEKKVMLLRWPVDEKFWRPIPRQTDMICAVGREMRDYVTFVRAMRDLPIPCHIAAGGLASKKDAWIEDLEKEGPLPSHITMGKKKYLELRDLYANSRFVVIPLLPTETDNGTTTILEAMAMGKAVICTRVEGQADVIQDGVNGIFVPAGDVQALHDAVEYLWTHPSVADKMGCAGRKFVEEFHTLDKFVANVQKAVEDVRREKNASARMSAPQARRRILTVVTSGLSRPSPAELREMEKADLYPRALLYQDTLDSDMLDERYLQQLPGIKRLLYTALPPIGAQLIEAFLVRKKYEAVVTWSARLALPFAALLKLTGSRVPHIALVSWISKRKKAVLLKYVHSHMQKIVFWSSVQLEFARDIMHIPASKLALVSRRVDQKFWRPMNVPGDMICSAGQEMRDFPTLLKALEGLGIDCQIATGALRGKMFATVKAIDEAGPLPSNIKVQRLNYHELRALYARSRFVVIPLHQTDTDNGVTTMEEAMAMGKAVICTRTHGQVDHLDDGVSGIYVPPYDPEAMRNAILYLWNNPEIAERMGRAGRKHIEEDHTLDLFVQKVKRVVDDAIEEHRQDSRRGGRK